jgi:hypothetical protein
VLFNIDKSIRTLPFFSLYFILNYEFSKNYSEVNSCPILIIFELAQTEFPEVNLCPILIIVLSTKAEKYVVYNGNFQTIFRSLYFRLS